MASQRKTRPRQPRATGWALPPEIDEASVAETLDCEILVIGGGQSGSPCASFAAMNGANVLWIEANENPVYMRSSAISGINTKYQQEVGVEINPEDILNDVTHYALNQCSMKLWRGLGRPFRRGR